MQNRVLLHAAMAFAFCATLLATNAADAQVAPPYFEDFESESTCGVSCGNACVLSTTGWTNDTTDDYDWTVDAGGTTSGSTGPSGDHTTGSGQYLYTETSSPCFNAPNTFNLISPPLDLTAVTTPVAATFWYHMYGQSMGNLHVDVSTDGGASFTPDIIPPITDDLDQWQQSPNIDLTAYQGQTVHLRLRSEGATDFYGDMAIDDFELFVVGPDDVGATATYAPGACGLTANTHLVVEVTNFGTAPQSGFPIQVSVNGGAPVVETFPGTLLPLATVAYTFNAGFDLSGPGPFALAASTNLAGDTKASNDSATGSATNLPILGAAPAIDSFDDPSLPAWSGSGAGNEWQVGLPSDGILNSAYDGTSSWVTDLDATYASNADNTLTSPYCFDLSSTSNPAVSLAIWWQTESGFDGAVLQASTNGTDWTTIGAVGGGTNWYDLSGVVAAPGGSTDAWSGASGGWVIASNALSGFAGEPGVLLRIAFASDSATVDEGVAIDRVVVYDDVTGLVASAEPQAATATSAGAVDVLTMSLTLFGSGAGDDVDAITVGQYGSITDANVAALNLYLDDGDRLFDPAIDALIDTQTLTAGQATFSTTGAPAIGTGQLQRLFVSADVGAGAMTGDTLGIEVASPGTDIVTAGASPVVAANLVAGPELIVGGPGTLPFIDDFGSVPPNRAFLTAAGTYPNATMLGLTTGTITTSNDAFWEFFTDAGAFDQAPLSGGSYAVLAFPNGEATGAVEYVFDLSAYTAATDPIALAFRYGDNADESDDEDYVFLSPDGGTNWIAVYDLDPGSLTNDTWQDVVVDLSAPLVAASLDYTNDVRIRLQGSDNSSLTGGDGLAFDEVVVDLGPVAQLDRDGAIIVANGMDPVGAVPAAPQTLTYTITNVGGFTLDVGPGFFFGNEVNTTNITVNPATATTLDGGESTTFTVDFEPGLGAFSFDVAVTFGASSTFTFTVDGTGAEDGPEIDVQRPAGTTIGSGSSDPQGDVDTTASASATYTIENVGFQDLSITAVDIGSPVNATAAVVDLPATVVAPGETTEVTVSFSPDGAGAFSFDLQLSSNDADENPYSITLDGNGIDTDPMGTGGGATTGPGGTGGTGGTGTGGNGTGGSDGGEDDGGCGCRVTGHNPDGTGRLAAISLLALGLVLRRRRD